MSVSVDYDNIVCHACENGEQDDLLMLCDGCPRGYHTFCIGLPCVPSDDWFCPRCVKEGKNVVQHTITNGLKTVLYERVSSKGQDEPQYGRVGIDTQNHALLKFCCEHNLQVIATLREVGSAYNLLSKLRQQEKLVELKDTCILVYSVSRFSRRLEHGKSLLDKIHANKSWVYSITEQVSSSEPKFYTLLQNAENESKMISNRSIDFYKKTKEVGGWVGNQAPFGSMIVRDTVGIRRLAENPQEQEVAKQVKALFAEKHNCMEVVQYLNTNGITYRGKPWTSNNVMSVVNRIFNNFTKDLMETIPQEIPVSY
jgi:DNA invertase Pin-like site-specific DNA recombinase